MVPIDEYTWKGVVIPSIRPGTAGPASFLVEYPNRTTARFQGVQLSRRGYCAATGSDDMGDCETGLKGSWTLQAQELSSHTSARAACTARCARCSRCNFVSYSVRWKDCSWHANCSLDRLQQEVAGFFTLPMVRGTSTSGKQET